MRIGLVEGMERLQELESAWREIYRLDPESQFYLSWPWLSAYLQKTAGDWLVLVATPEGEDRPVAFLPVRLQLKRRRKSGKYFNTVNMAGNYAADYTGFLCLPEFEAQALTAFAGYLKTMPWARLSLDNLCVSDRRRSLFLEAFSEKTYRIQSGSRINRLDGVDNLICPYVDLPDSFETYLNESLSANTRQKLRRLLRRLDGGDDYHVSHAKEATLERDLEILLRFWREQWGRRKGAQAERIVSSNRVLLRNAFEAGYLSLPVLWKNERPVAALGSYLDHEKKSVLFMIGGRDPSFDEMPAGLALHAHSIRHAIENGFRTYDLLRGNEPYKYSLGARDRVIECITVSTRTGLNPGDRLAQRSLPTVFKEVTALHQRQLREEAETGYRQILATAPNHVGALYGLGQLLAAKGDDKRALGKFEKLAVLQPGRANVWLRLAHARKRLSQLASAGEAYRKAAELDKKLLAAHYGLAKCLADEGHTREATDVLQSMMRLPPRSEDDKEVRRQAVRLLGVLRPSLTFHHPLVQPGSSLNKSMPIVVQDKSAPMFLSKIPGK